MKTTRIYLNGSYRYVKNTTGEQFEIYTLAGNRAVLEASGSTLLEAVREYDLKRDCRDDIGDAFVNSKFYGQVQMDEDFDIIPETYDRAYENFLDSLDGDAYFDIVRDGSYTAYVDWNEISEE